MVNANEWLNNKIPADERERATTLYIYSKCQCTLERTLPSFGQLAMKPTLTRDDFFEFEEFEGPPPPITTSCQHCNNKDQNNRYTAPDYCFCNVILEGELDLNDFVNLKILYIEGIEQNNQQQKLTKLKVDKCIKLTEITINHTTLGYLSLGRKPELQRTNFIGNKQLIFCDSVLKIQVERLTSLIQNTKVINLIDLKLELKKIEEENLNYMLDVTKSNLDEIGQFVLESLVEAQQEVLQSNSTYARKQLEKCKKKLAEVLTDEEIQYILGKKV